MITVAEILTLDSTPTVELAKAVLDKAEGPDVKDARRVYNQVKAGRNIGGVSQSIYNLLARARERL